MSISPIGPPMGEPYIPKETFIKSQNEQEAPPQNLSEESISAEKEIKTASNNLHEHLMKAKIQGESSNISSSPEENSLESYILKNFMHYAGERAKQVKHPDSHLLLHNLAKFPTQFFIDSPRKDYVIGTKRFGKVPEEKANSIERFNEIKSAIVDLLVTEGVPSSMNPGMLNELLHFSTQQWLSPQEVEINQKNLIDQTEWTTPKSHPAKELKTTYSVERQKTVFSPFKGIPKAVVVTNELAKPLVNLNNQKEIIITYKSQMRYDLDTDEIKLTFSYTIDNKTYQVAIQIINNCLKK